MAKNTPQHRATQTDRSGFTLAEVMVSLLLVALGTAGIFGLASALRGMNHLADTVSDATILTQSKIEDLRGQDYVALTSGTDTVGAYTRTWTVTTNATRTDALIRTEWTDRQGLKVIESATVFTE